MDPTPAQAALEQALQPRRDHPTPPPPRGWIRAIRDALGMTTRNLAARAGVSAPRITQIEQAEVTGAPTLATLERTAAALGCRLEYVLIPEQPLHQMVQQRARQVAAELHADVTHTMALEGQTLTEDAHQQLLEQLTDQAAATRGLWDDN